MRKSIIILFMAMVGGLFSQSGFSQDVFDEKTICRGAYYAILGTTSSVNAEKLTESNCTIQGDSVTFGDINLFKKVKFLIEKENIIVNIDYSYNSYKCIFSLNELNNSFRDSFDVRRVNWGDSPTSVKAKEKVLSFKNEPIKEDPNHIFYFTRIFGHNCSIIYKFTNSKLSSLYYQFDTSGYSDSKKLFEIIVKDLSERYKKMYTDEKLEMIFQKFKSDSAIITAIINPKITNFPVFIQYKDTALCDQESAEPIEKIE